MKLNKLYNLETGNVLKYFNALFDIIKKVYNNNQLYQYVLFNIKFNESFYHYYVNFSPNYNKAHFIHLYFILF